jgi:hypothetical protein
LEKNIRPHCRRDSVELGFRQKTGLRCRSRRPGYPARRGAEGPAGRRERRGEEPPRGPRPGKPLEPAKINPHELLERGDDVLRKALWALDLGELKSVVGQYGLDVGNALKGVRSKKKYADQIVDETKKEKEKVFWKA